MQQVGRPPDVQWVVVHETNVSSGREHAEDSVGVWDMHLAEGEHLCNTLYELGDFSVCWNTWSCQATMTKIVYTCEDESLQFYRFKQFIHVFIFFISSFLYINLMKMLRIPPIKLSELRLFLDYLLYMW